MNPANAEKRSPSPGQMLAVAALILGVLAPVVGTKAVPGRPGVAELYAELATGAPLVDGVTVGEWVRDRRPVRLVDTRDSSAFIRFSVPTAENVSLAGLAGVPVDSSRPVVVYGNGDGTAARSWLLLRRLGHPDVRVLERGVQGWIDGIVNPVLPAGTPAERARYERVARVSRYFGGVPRVGDPPDRSGRTAEDAVQLLSRRGCY